MKISQCYSCKEIALGPDTFQVVEVYSSPSKAKTKYVCNECVDALNKYWPELVEQLRERQEKSL